MREMPAPGDNLVDVRLPQWGMGMQDGEIVEWLCDVDDAVEEGTPLVEVETAKVSGVVESPVAGRLASKEAIEGDVVPVRGLLARIEMSN